MQTQGFVDNYRFLARYNRWFNERLYAACEQLSPEERQRDRGAFFGSIQATLAHLVWADKTWLARFAAPSSSARFSPQRAADGMPGRELTQAIEPGMSAKLRRPASRP